MKEEEYLGPKLNSRFSRTQLISNCPLQTLIGLVTPSLCFHIRALAAQFDAEKIRSLNTLFEEHSRRHSSVGAVPFSHPEQVLLEENLFPDSCYLEFFKILELALTAQKNGDLLTIVRNWLSTYPQLLVQSNSNDIRTSFAILFYPRSFIQRAISTASQMELDESSIGVLPVSNAAALGVVIKIFEDPNTLPTPAGPYDPQECARYISLNDTVVHKTPAGPWIFRPPVLS